MIAPAMRHWVTAAALAALATVPRAAPADAADASMWDGDARSAMRLVAGSAGADRAALRAGVELRLGTGWKTYWRYPGDSGVPPRFDFSKSTNVKSVAVRWPAPHRFTDENGASIGYKGGVLLPLDIVPADPKQPVTLRLTLEYAICEKLCIPADGSATLAVPAPSSFDRALAAAAAHVPREAALGGSGPLAVRSVRHEPGTSRVVVEVAAPDGRAARSLRRRSDRGLGASPARAGRRAPRRARTAFPSSSTASRRAPPPPARHCVSP